MTPHLSWAIIHELGPLMEFDLLITSDITFIHLGDSFIQSTIEPGSLTPKACVLSIALSPPTSTARWKEADSVFYINDAWCSNTFTTDAHKSQTFYVKMKTQPHYHAVDIHPRRKFIKCSMEWSVECIGLCRLNKYLEPIYCSIVFYLFYMSPYFNITLIIC